MAMIVTDQTRKEGHRKKRRWILTIRVIPGEGQQEVRMRSISDDMYQDISGEVLLFSVSSICGEPKAYAYNYIGLRQAPPQRVLFPPDVSSTRQRNTSSHMHSPQPTSHSGGYAYNNPSSNPNSTNFSISNYEPRMQMPLTLRPVVTPSNNLPVFQEKIKQLQDARATQLGLKTAPPLGMMLPGSQ